MKWVFVVSGLLVLAALAYLIFPIAGRDPEFNMPQNTQAPQMEDGKPVGFRGPTAPPSVKGPTSPPPVAQ